MSTPAFSPATSTTDDILKHLQTSATGLTDAEAKKRLVQYGSNRLTEKKKISSLSIYLSQFKNSLILTLIAAAILVLFVWYFGEREQADLIEAGLILVIVVLITFLGFFQEFKAEKAVEALRKLLAFKAKVVRGGVEKEIDVALLVPGDRVILEEGEKVPADIRLTEVHSLGINEASLTGESTPVNKTSDALEGVLQIADQKNMVFSGTVVNQGRAIGFVVTTGDTTEIGKIATYVSEVEEEQTPIQKRLDSISKILGYTVLGVAVLVFLFVVFFASDFTHLSSLQRVIHSFIAAIALAVAAIPEGLPAVVTISLALGTQRMLKRKALVRKLNSIETLGSTDVICSDKTGTLTKGEMTVRELYYNRTSYELTGTGYDLAGDFMHDGAKTTAKDLELLLTAGFVCNNAQLEAKGILGDPTEAALLVSAAKAALSPTFTRVEEIPFNSERKMMSVLVEDKGAFTVFSKGAAEIVLTHCDSILIAGRAEPLTAAYKKEILDQTLAMSQKALRTLGFAYKETKTPEKDEKQMESGLTFIGLQGMIDPPRAEVKPLVTQCHDSGIRIIMITGDHAATAAAVAAEIGIPGKTVTGEELDALSDAEFANIVKEVNIYARVNPGFKMRIVEALKKHKHIVAVTGDGVNDAPALKKADIGIAMGITGTDVAKESSDMVLLDDRFPTIVSAIEEGRGVFDNIRKFVAYLLSCNIGEVFIVFFAVVLFQDFPLSATMLLWINVITDGLPAVALGMDPAEKNIMRYKPKKFQGDIITRQLWIEMLLFGVLLTAGVLGLYAANLHEGHEEARSAAFTALVVWELARVFHIRSRYNMAFFSNIWLIIAVLVSFGLQLVITYVPFLAKIFGIKGIDWHDWALIAIGCVLLWAIYAVVQAVFGSVHGSKEDD